MTAQPRLLVACIALVACASAPRATPSSTARGVPSTTLRVMTYNIHAGHGDIDRTAATIRALSPDIVGLEEVDVHWADRSGYVDQASRLGESLGMHVRFAHIYDLPGPSADAPKREFGVALLSRYPIVTWENDTLTRLSTQTENAVPTRMPGLLAATIDVHGARVRVFVTHLDYRKDPSVRRTQVAEMLARIGAVDSPTLLLGDMNASPDAAELQPLFARIHDSWLTTAGPGFTYPADTPAERIDYVLLSPNGNVDTAFVPSVPAASDHRPVVVNLSFGRT
ncbi:MAG TPA: endonuclease/exonuclease/phosphatase family protein [Gemmatimonadaceae bacterium]